jgi:hypothetical protein
MLLNISIKNLLALPYPSICPSVCVYECSCHWMDFREIWYWGCLWKSVEKTEILLKLDKSIGDLTWRPKYVLLLPVTLNHHRNVVLKWNGIRLFGAPWGYKEYVNVLQCDIIHTDILLQVLLWWSDDTAHTIKITSANHQNLHCACVLYITNYISDSNF